MSAYYNEIDKFAAAWLRELIKARLIADGEVDERDIRDVQPGDLAGFVQCHFFAGIGGWSYALRLAGWPDDRPVWTGSCPCQPLSAAGRGQGENDQRHLWPVWFPLIQQCGPSIVFGEQVASASGLQWIDLVFDDLESQGYAAAAADLCAPCVGAVHVRQRLFWMADSNCQGLHLQAGACSLGNIARGYKAGLPDQRGDASRLSWGGSEPEPVPMADGVSNSVGRLRGYGNAIVPQVAAAFIEAYQGLGR